MKENLKQNKEKIGFAAGLLLILAVLSPLMIDQALVNHQKLTFDASADISQRYNNSSAQLGVAPGTEGLDYGKMNIEANSTRFISVNAPEPTYFDFRAEGNISEYLSYTEEMKFQGARNVSVELRPEQTGNYTGRLVVKAEYAEGGLGKQWLKLKN